MVVKIMIIIIAQGMFFLRFLIFFPVVIKVSIPAKAKKQVIKVFAKLLKPNLISVICATNPVLLISFKGCTKPTIKPKIINIMVIPQVI